MTEATQTRRLTTSALMQHWDSGVPVAIPNSEVLSMADDLGRTRIESNLAQIGWNVGQRDLFDERWRLRSMPLALRVGPDFPRLTPGLLSKAGIDTAPLRHVAYEIDLTDRPASPNPPHAVAAVVEYLGEEADD